LNLWPLVQHEVEEMTLALYAKLTTPTGTSGLEAVRLIQGELQGYKAVLAIPRRAISTLEMLSRQKKEERDG